MIHGYSSEHTTAQPLKASPSTGKLHAHGKHNREKRLCSIPRGKKERDEYLLVNILIYQHYGKATKNSNVSDPWEDKQETDCGAFQMPKGENGILKSTGNH